MINYQEALQIIKAESAQFSIIEIDVRDSCNLISAQNIYSKIALPSFNNSAMDGFALKSADIKNASNDNPIKLPILKIIEAGDSTNNPKEISGAIEIMTGAKIPEGYDTVMIVEKAKIINDENDNRYLIIDEEIPINSNIRHIGEDFKINDLIISKGEIITPNHLMALLGTGIANIKVRKMPKIAIISTGKEIIDDYNLPLKEGQIYNSNSPYLLSYLKNQGFKTNYYGIIADDIAQFHQILDKIEEDGCDIIISTGAVSMGSKDFIKQELLNRQAKISFHKVSIRPGKPILFAKLNNCHYFGLPGNPISSVVGLQFFIMPFIQNSLAAKSKKPINAILKNSIKAKAGLLHFLKSYSYLENGKLITEILDGQQSFKIKPLIDANSLAIIDGNKNYRSGDVIEISPLNNLFK